MYIRSNIVYPHNLAFQMRYVLLFVDVDYMDTYYIYIYIYMYACMYVFVITARDRAETHGFFLMNV